MAYLAELRVVMMLELLLLTPLGEDEETGNALVVGDWWWDLLNDIEDFEFLGLLTDKLPVKLNRRRAIHYYM